ncbi:uncharacterized protein LTR77_009907 [Saxophila tyrrhenica]|uniref:O-methyltransferase C-terminal domain-containing protein n=1 Tax=Saxophila tyrrhenica TaxID=1690608 RepID=A0AAV9P076_9PEZI|nr:hypothetical protein LTR77_009907 [Saxophila tyrrhenica]
MPETVLNGSVVLDQVPVSIALSPNDVTAVPTCAENIHALAKTFDKSDNGRRLELLAHARSLVRALETPRETMIKHCWAQPGVYMAITMGVDIGLFKAMLANRACSKKVSDLAPLLDVDAFLLARVMRHLAAMGCIRETGPDEYELNGFSKSLTIPIIGDGYPCLAGGGRAALDKFSEYAATTAYQEPRSAEHGPFQYAYNTSLNFFAYLQARDPLGVQFNHHMGGYRQGRPSWMDGGFFPVYERLIQGARTDTEAVLLVDVGGNIGHDLDEFQRKHPDSPGRLVLQDLPEVLGQIAALDTGIERMSYDFLTEQPVKCARAYYMHSVLHDWPDDTCTRILTNLKAAMAPGYSKLLINENVIPDTQAHWEATALDMMMLALLSSKERTAAQWTHLIEVQAQLKIVKIWEGGNGVESLIECELP